MRTNELTDYIRAGKLDETLINLYGTEALETQKVRYTKAIEDYSAIYGDSDISLFSVPGRSEICGNHTDHQRGRVIAAAVNLDIIAVASKNSSGTVRVKSKGFDEDTVSLSACIPNDSKYATSEALIAGVCDGFVKRGFNVTGFNAYTTSSVYKGSGISSSAAFEDMIGNILNHFANEGKISAPVIAEISKYSENVFFGKPSGLMDQTACAVGGFCYIDFENPEAAKIEKLDFDMTKADYSLCITNTGGNHADLTADYASVPTEMKSVAAILGMEVLRGATISDLYSHTKEIREKCGDRAFLRAFHFIYENDRVLEQANRLKSNNLNAFFEGINDSGKSSFMWLQNVYTVKNPFEQGISLALAVSESLLNSTGRKSAWRIHGGGFAGTIQAFVPNEDVTAYKNGMEKIFGKDSCAVLSIRNEGAIKII